VPTQGVPQVPTQNRQIICLFRQIHVNFMELISKGRAQGNLRGLVAAG
jgi:hypothetical protein